MIPGLDHFNNEAQSFENTIYVGIVSDFKFVKINLIMQIHIQKFIFMTIRGPNGLV